MIGIKIINQGENVLTTQHTPSVSVIMNCLNSSKYLREAIDSVYAQTYKDWEIIFWDNASIDNSAEIAKGYDSKLRYFRSEETVILGKVRNYAIEKARGEFIAFLDCDDLWLPNKLERQIPFFKKNLKVGLVFCDTIFFNQGGKQKQIYKKNKPPRGQIFKELLTNYFLSMETVVIRREALDSLTEWFDERLTMNEEADLFNRIAYSWEADYIDEPLAKWRVHSNSITWTKKELITQETEIMLEKYLKTIPNFQNNFSNEIELIKVRILKQRALQEWEKGNTEVFRDLLMPYLGKDYKALALYFMSFLPYRMFNVFLEYYRQLKGNVLP